jgi:predicted nucleic acid-binding protein
MAGRVKTVVPDANLVMALAVELPYSERAIALMERWQRDRVPLYAPFLWEYELATALRKTVALGMFSEEQATAILERVLRLGVERIAPDAELHCEAVRWAGRLGQVAAYDAQYLALAARLGAELWSADKRLVTRARASGLDWVHDVSAGAQ